MRTHQRKPVSPDHTRTVAVLPYRLLHVHGCNVTANHQALLLGETDRWKAAREVVVVVALVGGLPADEWAKL